MASSGATVDSAALTSYQFPVSAVTQCSTWYTAVIRLWVAALFWQWTMSVTQAVIAQAYFRLGVFSSASERTVSQVIPMLEAAAGPGPPLFNTEALVLTRSHTRPAPRGHVLAGGDPWDTVKPLGSCFPTLRRIILVDDDSWKVCTMCCGGRRCLVWEPTGVRDMTQGGQSTRGLMEATLIVSCRPEGRYGRASANTRLCCANKG